MDINNVNSCLLRNFMNTPDLVYFTRRFELERGDVVILEDPKSKSGFLCKRVVALGGKKMFFFNLFKIIICIR